MKGTQIEIREHVLPGHIAVSISAGDNLHGLRIGIHGPAGEVADLLVETARKATDLAVALANPERPVYTPTGPIVDGEEVLTGRLECCGAGPDQISERTSERLHLPACPAGALLSEAAR